MPALARHRPGALHCDSVALQEKDVCATKNGRKITSARFNYRRLAAAAAVAVVVVIVTAAAENEDYKNDNPETVVVAEAAIVTKAHTLHPPFLSRLRYREYNSL